MRESDGRERWEREMGEKDGRKMGEIHLTDSDRGVSTGAILLSETEAIHWIISPPLKNKSVCLQCQPVGAVKKSGQNSDENKLRALTSEGGRRAAITQTKNHPSNGGGGACPERGKKLGKTFPL